MVLMSRMMTCHRVRLSHNADAAAYGTIYAKDPNGGWGTSCDTTPLSDSDNWPAVQAEWAHTPTAGAGVTAALTVYEHTDGKFYLRIGGCIAYHYTSNTDASPVQAVGQYWPLIVPTGARQTTVPGCS